jgi:S1-C subfamily serine protease
MANDLLSQLSSRIAALGADGATHVLRVEGRRRAPASGVAWSTDGLVVTAHHALGRDEEVRVGLPSGDEAPAELVGRDPTTDVAVLRVRGAALAPAPLLEEPSLAAGQLVVGISRPGRSPRVALGALARVAGEFRAAGGGRIDRFLETTLDLHRGLSGGLVLGPDGAAVGIATSALVRGAAMAIPAKTLRRVVKALLAHGEIRRGYLGIATYPVPLPTALRDATGEEVALLVSRVEPESPAARAGILLGDAILSVGGEAMQDPGALLALLGEERIGDTVAVRVLRAGEVRDLAVTVGARGGEP